MWDQTRDSYEPGQMSTDDLVTCYGLAGRLRSHEPAAPLDLALRLWMFTALTELESRGKLELIRDWLPVYYDPTKRVPLFGPRAALAAPPGDDRTVSVPMGMESSRHVSGAWGRPLPSRRVGHPPIWSTMSGGATGGSLAIVSAPSSASTAWSKRDGSSACSSSTGSPRRT